MSVWNPFEEAVSLRRLGREGIGGRRGGRESRAEQGLTEGGKEGEVGREGIKRIERVVTGETGGK